MRIAAGLVAAHPFVVHTPGTTLVQFSISLDRLSDTEMLDSGSAPPGRYAGEMLRRLRRMYPGAEAYLTVNPQLGLSAEVLQRVLDAARGADAQRHGWWLLCDDARRLPLAYMLRADRVDQCPAVHLALLSAADVDLDERFLRASFGPGQSLQVGAVSAGVSGIANGFTGYVNQVYYDITRRAALLLEAAPSDAARLELVQHGERVAVIGFHAGDVLFTLQALAHEQTRFRAVVVPRDYADIVRLLSPHLLALVVDAPVPNRGAYQVPDEMTLLLDYVAQVEGQAGARFFHLVRPLYRDCPRTRHNLREVIAFAIGGAGHRLRPSPALPGASPLRRAPGALHPGRVVLQFDAGWPLKNTPPEQRAEILDLLIAGGYQPVIVGPPEPSHPDVPARPYTDLAAFCTLLCSAEALVGCDSFPAHFAEQLGVPTVVLFGPTRPTIARSLESPRYRVLHHPMPCVPCGQQVLCKLDQGHGCHAFATAGEVLAALEAILPQPAARCGGPR